MSSVTAQDGGFNVRYPGVTLTHNVTGLQTGVPNLLDDTTQAGAIDQDLRTYSYYYAANMGQYAGTPCYENFNITLEESGYKLLFLHMKFEVTNYRDGTPVRYGNVHVEYTRTDDTVVTINLANLRTNGNKEWDGFLKIEDNVKQLRIVGESEYKESYFPGFNENGICIKFYHYNAYFIKPSHLRMKHPRFGEIPLATLLLGAHNHAAGNIFLGDLYCYRDGVEHIDVYDPESYGGWIVQNYGCLGVGTGDNQYGVAIAYV